MSVIEIKNSLTKNAPASKVWKVLTQPEYTKIYFIGCVTVSKE